jgi:gamma-butyrobetaine dioxygenase
VVLERLVGLPRGRLVAEDPPEHLDLGLAHARPDLDPRTAGAALRAADAESFDTLARTPVPFGYMDKETKLRASQPLIQLSPRGRVRGVRFNNRSAQPLRLPYAEVAGFYAAYRRWAELPARPERRLNRRGQEP